MFIFLGIIFLIMSMIFFLLSKSIQKKENAFMQSYKEATGEIIGYRQIDEGDDKPKVSVVINGKNVVVEAKAVKMNSQTHPVGTQVRIAYISIKVMGIAGYDARIINQDGAIPKSNNKIIILNVIAGILFIISIFLIIMFIGK